MKNGKIGIAVAIMLVSSLILGVYLLNNPLTQKKPILVACVGDSLTQSTRYPYELWSLLGNESFTLRNFGAGSTTVLLNSETPYMNTTAFQDALEFEPNIVIIMLGTNDAQPNLHQYNTSFVKDYIELVSAFRRLSSKPEIRIVLPPPIFSNETVKIGASYFEQTIIPLIKQVAYQTNLSTIDVHNILINYSDYFSDGIHPNDKGAELIANTIYNAVFLKDS